MTAAGLFVALRRALPRWAAFMLLWVVLGRVGVADLIAGAVTAALAAALSVMLVPPAPALSVAGVVRFAGRFLVRSGAAAVDVARRVFDPRLPIRPGMVQVACGVPPGFARGVYRATLSLQPGSLPLDNQAGGMTLHCLDAATGVEAALEADEAAFLAAADLRDGRGARA